MAGMSLSIIAAPTVAIIFGYFADGRSNKMPVDAQPQDADDVYEKYAEEVVHRVTAVYPDLTYDQFRKLSFLLTDGRRQESCKSKLILPFGT
jgi:hypothetical protein